MATRADAATGRAVRYAKFAVGYNLIEGIVAVAAGAAARAISLTGFGVDSGIEVAAATVVLVRLLAEIGCAEPDEAKERRVEGHRADLLRPCGIRCTPRCPRFDHRRRSALAPIPARFLLSQGIVHVDLRRAVLDCTDHRDRVIGDHVSSTGRNAGRELNCTSKRRWVSGADPGSIVCGWGIDGQKYRAGRAQRDAGPDMTCGSRLMR